MPINLTPDDVPEPTVGRRKTEEELAELERERQKFKVTIDGQDLPGVKNMTINYETTPW